MAVKIGVTSHSSKSFEKNAPKEDDIKLNSDAKLLQSTAEAKFQKINEKTVKVDEEIATTKESIAKLQAERAKPSKTPAETLALQTEIDTKTNSLAALQHQRDSLDQPYKAQKDQYKVASKISDKNSAHIEQLNTAASKEVQTFRAFLDITDSGGAVLQNTGKIITASTTDVEAANAKIASEMAAYMVNSFASAIQNDQKSTGQMMDGMNSVSSSCNASIQSADSSNSLAVRAV
jgi:altronate dehydratase